MSLIPILADVIFSPFDLAWYYAGRYWPVLLLIAAAACTGQDARGAFRIWRRDRRNHSSPNSAQTESAMAGALGVRLAGPASYFGTLHDKPYIGDDRRPISPADICTANRMLYVGSALALLALGALRAGIALLCI